MIEEWEDDVFLTHDGSVYFTDELDKLIEFYDKHIRIIVAKLAERNPGNGGDPLLSADAMNQLFAHHKREQAKGIRLSPMERKRAYHIQWSAQYPRPRGILTLS